MSASRVLGGTKQGNIMSDGIKTLEIKLDRIIEEAGKAEYVREAGEYVQAAARLRAPGNSGHLRQNIVHDFEQGHFSATSKVHTNNVSYAEYVEHGTGPEGMKNHEGISPNVTPAYRMTPWWIPESEIDPGLAEQYHWPSIDTPEGKFYKCSGQPARPYLYPALKDNEETVVDIMQNGLNDVFKKVCK